MESRLRWVNNGLPQKGWELIEVEDAGDDASSCPWCGTSIRYIHHLVHSLTRAQTSAGCVCCEHLTGDYVGPRTKEAALKRQQERLARWLNSPRWKLTGNGNHYRRDHDILIFMKQGSWWLKYGKTWDNQPYSTLEGAMRAAFKVLRL